MAAPSAEGHRSAPFTFNKKEATMKKVLVILFTLIALAVSPPAWGEGTNKDLDITLGGGVSQIINGVHQDVVQVGVPISKHLIVVLTTQYQADGIDSEGSKLCFYYVDFNKKIKVYISIIERDPIDVLVEGNETYLDYLIEVGEVVFGDGGIYNLIRACKNGYAPQTNDNGERGLFNIN